MTTSPDRPHVDPDFHAAFGALPGMYLLLDPDLTILGASDEYLRLTMTQREQIVGKRVFDIFPDDPDDPHADGEKNVRASFERVLREGVPHTIPAVKFDIARPEAEGGGFEERFWRTHNRPVLGADGGVRYILNCVDDVTDIMQMRGATDLLERDVQRGNDLTRLIIARAHSAFVSMDVAGRITEWNPSAERMFGWSRGEVVGQKVAEVVMPVRYREAHERGLKRFLATGEGPVLDTTIELEAIYRDGREFPIALTISPIELEGEYSFHAFMQDITQRKEAVRLVEKANQELLHADEIKSRFLAMASHELRTPLTAIAGFTTTMLNMDEQLTANQRHEFLEIIDRQAARLSRLVDDLLTLSKIEGGNFSCAPERTQIALAIKQTLHELDAGHVDVDCQPDLSACADPDHLQQILTNYVSNAIKYGEEPIRITVEQHDDSVVIAVCDHGAGVPTDFAPHLFGRFERARQSTKVEGSGLGLSIVRGLANAQGGDAWHEPNEPTGSRFCLRLPTNPPATTGS